MKVLINVTPVFGMLVRLNCFRLCKSTVCWMKIIIIQRYILQNKKHIIVMFSPFELKHFQFYLKHILNCFSNQFIANSKNKTTSKRYYYSLQFINLYATWFWKTGDKTYGSVMHLIISNLWYILSMVTEKRQLNKGFGIEFKVSHWKLKFQNETQNITINTEVSVSKIKSESEIRDQNQRSTFSGDWYIEHWYILTTYIELGCFAQNVKLYFAKLFLLLLSFLLWLLPMYVCFIRNNLRERPWKRRDFKLFLRRSKTTTRLPNLKKTTCENWIILWYVVWHKKRCTANINFRAIII